MNDMNLEAASYAFQCWSGERIHKRYGKRVQRWITFGNMMRLFIKELAKNSYAMRPIARILWTIWWDVGASGTVTSPCRRHV
jgi:hypothetical protein